MVSDQSEAKAETRQLVLVRHAKSAWDDPALQDAERPLASRGLKALPKMSAYLEDLRPRPDVVLCSPARRARETLDGIRAAFPRRTTVEIIEEIYLAHADELLECIHRVTDGRCVLMIGHNPGLTDLVDLLVTADSPVAMDLPTGAIAVLSFDGVWRDLAPSSATLVDLWRPRDQPG